MSNIFMSVKDNVTTRQAAEFYGIQVHRNGMCCCPFHPDRNPSMKVDSRYHCFGCGADGDVIDFTAQLFNLPVKEAAEKLAMDFGIAYDEQPHSDRPRDSPSKSKWQEAQEYQQAENRIYRAYCDYLHLLRGWKEELAPSSPDEELNPLFVEALHNIGYVEYLLDELFDGSIKDRAAIVKEKGKEVIELEKRISEFTARGTEGRDGSGKADELAGHQKAKPGHGFNDRAL